MKQRLVIIFIFNLSVSIFAQQNPDWIIQPEKYFDNNVYIFGVGEGGTAEVAKNQAFAQLSRIFGTSVQQNVTSQETVSTTRKTSSSHDYSLNNNITLESEHDLLNINIEKTFEDKRAKKYYALAVMNKQETADILVNLIGANFANISVLVDSADSVNDALKKSSLLKQSIEIAKGNESYIAQLTFLDADNAFLLLIDKELLLPSLQKKLLDVSEQITFAVATQPVVSSIGTAIKVVLTDLDVVLANSNAAYILDVYFENDSSELFGQIKLNYTLYVDIKNPNTNEDLKTFSFSGQQIAGAEKEAINRSIRDLNKIINTDFKNEFINYLNER